MVDTECGARLDIPPTINDLPWEWALLSESGGFLLEVPEEMLQPIESLFSRHGVRPVVIGATQDEHFLEIVAGGTRRTSLSVDELAAAWRRTIPELMT